MIAAEEQASGEITRTEHLLKPRDSEAPTELAARTIQVND